jgi:hypothetical protein
VGDGETTAFDICRHLSTRQVFIVIQLVVASATTRRQAQGALDNTG